MMVRILLTVNFQFASHSLGGVHPFSPVSVKYRVVRIVSRGIAIISLFAFSPHDILQSFRYNTLNNCAMVMFHRKKVYTHSRQEKKLKYCAICAIFRYDIFTSCIASNIAKKKYRTQRAHDLSSPCPPNIPFTPPTNNQNTNPLPDGGDSLRRASYVGLHSDGPALFV